VTVPIFRSDKPVFIDIDFYSFRHHVAGLRQLERLVLTSVTDAIQVMTEYAEEAERLRGVLDRVRIRHVDHPSQRVFTLTGGVLEPAVCLVDPNGGDELAGGPSTDDVIDVVRQAMPQT